ncbi:hypothetical protein CFIMG_007185RA00001 [Ceratocystis fimbriata CBS 114723]|uniref:DAGKc domain-containing protein n=1 Tax=Ceratocystis fimbriata CBS 114723 TaxID=1035309 RepID=A0A2C5XMR8_9PEZI|nr:hypothetical protein CFIMG_007185RA00001 [Ceratocystis fimbriata CBS 114723]
MSRCSPASKEWTEPLSTNATSSFDAIFDDPQSIVAIFKQARGFTVFAALDTGHGVNVSYAIKCVDVPAVPSLLEPLIISRCPRHLQVSDSRKLHVVVSTKSGLCLATKCWNQVVKPLLNAVQSLSSTTHKGQYSLLITENAESIKSFAAKILRAEESAQTVLLMSGDGGTVDLINAMNQDEKQPSPTTIAILPLGTGNALFHSIHRPLYSNSTESALILGLRTLIHGTPVSLPLFRADFSPGARIVTFVQSQNNMTSRPVDYLYGSIVASHGFHASIVYESDTPEYRKHGDRRFGMVANELLELNHAYKATVEVRRPDCSDFRSLGGNEFNYILSTLVSNLERTFTISPDSHTCDGKLRVVTFAPLGKDKVMEIMMAAYNNGAHVSMPEVTYEEIKELRVSVHEPDDRWRKFCVDGTIVAVQEGGWMKVKALSTSPFKVLTTPSI